MAGSEATLGKTLGHGDWQTPGHSVFQQLHEQVSMISISTTLLRQTTKHPHLLRLMIQIVTATITSLCSLLLQHPLRLYDLHCYSTYYVLWPISLQQLLRPDALYCYSIYSVFINYTVTAPITSLWSIWLQHLLRPYDLYRHSTYYIFCSILLKQLLRR